MANLFPRNIDRKGRIIRAVIGLVLLIAAVFIGLQIWWAGLGLGLGAAFVFFEAARGWCVARACGIRTKY
jgi:hypothetical protein